MKKTYKKMEERLTSEGAELRQPVAELEAPATDHRQAGQLLRKTEVDKLDVLNSISELVTYQDTEHRVLWTNKAAAESVGLTTEQLVGRYCYEIWPQRSQPCEGCPVAKARQTGKPQKAEITTPDGRTWSIRGYPILDEYDRVTGIIEVTLDITERKKTEQALRESEEKTRKMFESVTDGISVVDLNSVITEVNQRMVEMHGLGSKDELVGKNAFNLVSPHDREKIAVNMGEAIKQGTIRDVEYTLLKADGSEFPAELGTSALKDASGKVIGHITVSRDITERKRAEEALRESEEKYKELAESITDIFFAFDKDLKYTYWNKASEQLTGVSAKNALGKHLYDIFPDSEMTRQVEKVYLKALRTQQVQSLVNEYHLGGRDCFFEISAYPSKNGLSVFTRDITERKQAAEREKAMQQELLLSSRLASIGELAAGVAHQINNPLTGVLGFSQRLLKKSTDQATKQDLKIIYTEAERAAKVVQNLLTFARRRQPRKQYSDINEILESALELRAYELKTSNIEVITDLDPKLPEIMLDFYQIQEVFLNIILNAEQALTEAHNGGKLTIMTVERRGYVRTTFTDDGPGIPAESLDNIFDPFYTTKAEKGGTGLGLSVCHGIITEHGGKIYAKSKPGKGATFFVELPLTHN